MSRREELLALHVPAAYLSERAHGATFRVDKSGAVKMVTDYDTCWFFRGTRIDENTSVPRGYWGRWETRKLGASSLREMVSMLEHDARYRVRERAAKALVEFFAACAG